MCDPTASPPRILWNTGSTRVDFMLSRFTHLDRYERDASTHILKGQIKAFLCHRAHLPDLSVEAKNSISEVSLSETLICCDGVHLKVDKKISLVPRQMPPGVKFMEPWTNFGVVCGSKPCRWGQGFISLKVKEVKGFLTGTRHPRDGVTVSESEAQLHKHLRKNRTTEQHFSTAEGIKTTFPV